MAPFRGSSVLGEEIVGALEYCSSQMVAATMMPVSDIAADQVAAVSVDGARRRGSEGAVLRLQGPVRCRAAAVALHDWGEAG